MSSKRRNRQSSSSAVNFNIDEGGTSSRILFTDPCESNVKFNFADFENILRKYSGEDTMNIRNWIREFEQYAETFRWNSLQRFIFCKRSLCGAAKMYVECEAKALTYNDLKDALLREFESKINSADVHKKLRERKKKENESFREYLYKLIEIASQVDIDDSSIISYAIDGIRDSPVNKTILYGSRTITEFKEKLFVYEKMKPDQSRNVAERSGDIIRKDYKKNSEKKRYCFNCGANSHEFHNCPEKQKGPKCFKCNQYGHKRDQCKSTTFTEQFNVPKTANVLRRNDMYQPVKINDAIFDGLIDTGSDICLIKERLIKYINPKSIFRENEMDVRGIGANIRTRGSFIAKITIDGSIFDQVEVHVGADDIVGPDLIIGMNLLQRAIVTIDGRKIRISKKKENLDECEAEKEKDEEMNDLPGCFLSKISVNEADDKYFPDLSHVQSKDVANEVQSMIANYSPKLPKSSPIQMKIVPIDDVPVCQRPRRFPPKEQELINSQVSEWLKNNIITESSSDYASNVVLVKKKDGTHRLCVDFRMLNKKIHKEHYPLPVIEDQVDKLQGARFFTTLDLENGFFHVTIEEGSRRFTSFVTQQGQFEFLRVPFGLCNSPSIFQKYINYIFRDLIKEGICIIYIDDIVIPSKSIGDGLDRLKITLLTAAENGLKIKWKKCQILQEKIEYLGHRIHNGSISPSIDKTKAVVNFPIPNTTKRLQSFLGLASYFRKFIPQFALKAKPLTDLLKKDAKFKFEGEQRNAWELLKQELAQEPVLRIFRYGAQTELHTDASKYGLGAVLLQRGDDDNALHPVYYWSKKTSRAEQNYTSYELEALAIVESVKKFRIYLLGQRFKIVTDCKALECTLRKKDLSTRVVRWAMLLEEYEYEVEHRAGTRLKHADALSRLPEVMCISRSNEFLRKLEEAQKNDERLNAIIKLLENESYRDYVMQHNILCKTVDNKILFVVPDQMQQQIIRDVHDRGHFHLKKMKEVIEKEFYIQNLARKVQKHIASCIKCILSERKSGRKESLLHPIPKGEFPLDTFHIDHLGPMAVTKKHYKYIFAIIDGFTKYCWLFPVKTLNTEEVVQKIEIVADTFGYPARIIADRGGAFTSVQFQTFCSSHDIKCHLITTGVPRGNGQVERLHSTVISVLTKMSLDDCEKWFVHVRPLQRILNSTFQRAIGTTPFQLLIGTKMRTEEDIKITELIDEESQKIFEEEREELRQKAKLEINKIQEENSRTYNKRRKQAIKYVVGDQVAIERTQFGVGLKVKPKFLGPYEVTVVKGFDRYKVKKIGEHEGPKVTDSSADKMKPWMEGDEEVEEYEDLGEGELAEDPEDITEQISSETEE